MNEEKREAVYGTLSAISEAIETFHQTFDEQLFLDIAEGRKQVTLFLEQELHCSLQKQIDIDGLADEEWLLASYRILDQILNPFQPQNKYDKSFMELLGYIWRSSKAALLKRMTTTLSQWKKEAPNNYMGFVQYFSRFPLWGTFDPENGDNTTLELRVQVLKRHSYDFLWLYRRLEDYLSKRTLYAILKNWAFLDTRELTVVKSIFPDYYEPSIFPDNRDDVFVDVGAFIGDSIIQYVQTYGTSYRKIYAYEITEESCRSLRKNTAGLHDVVIRQRGVGREPGEMVLENSKDSSANRLRDAIDKEAPQNVQGGQPSATVPDGDERKKVKIVTLDEDVEDVITFLKMDIEGAEQDALMGCEKTIRKHHPKLAICVYHGYEDIWKIPFMIDCMYPGYHLYLRHNGGNLIPTEFVLLCKTD